MPSLLASTLAKRPIVREYLKKAQQHMGQRVDLVAEGRDMGSVVFPQAQYKFFLEASVAARTMRRVLQLKAMGKEANQKEIAASIIEIPEMSKIKIELLLPCVLQKMLCVLIQQQWTKNRYLLLLWNSYADILLIPSSFSPFSYSAPFSYSSSSLFFFFYAPFLSYSSSLFFFFFILFRISAPSSLRHPARNSQQSSRAEL